MGCIGDVIGPPRVGSLPGEKQHDCHQPRCLLLAHDRVRQTQNLNAAAIVCRSLLVILRRIQCGPPATRAALIVNIISGALAIACASLGASATSNSTPPSLARLETCAGLISRALNVGPRSSVAPRPGSAWALRTVRRSRATPARQKVVSCTASS